MRILSAKPWIAAILAAASLAGQACGETAPSLAVSPRLVRCDLAPNETRAIVLDVTSATDARLLAVETDCRCVQATTPLPLELPAGRPVAVSVRVVGVLPGLKTLTLRSTAGPATATIEVVCAGTGQGRDQLSAALAAAAAAGGEAWFVVRDLRGEVRNCGCSDGALGGIDRLAALPRLCREIAPTLRARFILVGDSDGMRVGVADALARHGWEPKAAEVVASQRPDADIADDRLVAVVPEAPTPLNHAKLVRIPLDGGVLVAALVVVDGRLREQRLITVDRSLAAEAGILDAFAGSLSRRVDAAADPSASCAGCHAAAHAAWATSAHARAWSSLAAADRIDACAGCHSTALDAATIATGVHCQSCHQGAAAHAAAPTTTRTAGVTDCRSCHDERRHPSFDRGAAWSAILHGR